MRSLKFAADELQIVKQLPLITAKPLVFVCNIDVDSMVAGSNELADKFIAYTKQQHPTVPVVTLSALLENEIVKIRNDDGEEQAMEFMQAYGLKESKLD